MLEARGEVFDRDQNGGMSVVELSSALAPRSECWFAKINSIGYSR